MSTLASRIAKLETQAGAGRRGRFIRVMGGNDFTHADWADFLATQGIEMTADDMIINRHVIAPGPNGPVACMTEPRLMTVVAPTLTHEQFIERHAR
jgi:hypothetical protein